MSLSKTISRLLESHEIVARKGSLSAEIRQHHNGQWEWRVLDGEHLIKDWTKAPGRSEAIVGAKSLI